MVKIIGRSVYNILWHFIDWLDTKEAMGTIAVTLYVYLILEMLTGFPSWYFSRIIQGLYVFVFDYIWIF